MDHAGVASCGANGKPLWLDDRINLLSETNKDIATNLKGIKLLGNAGSHDSRVDSEDLLDALEILEHALNELIDRPSERMAMLAQDLTDKYGK